MAEGLRRPKTTQARSDQFSRRLCIGSPGRVNRERSRTAARAQPVAGAFSSDLECSGCTSLVRGPRAVGDEQAMGNADRRDVEDGAEVERETRTARMIATGRIHEQDVRLLRETSDRP